MLDIFTFLVSLYGGINFDDSVSGGGESLGMTVIPKQNYRPDIFGNSTTKVQFRIKTLGRASVLRLSDKLQIRTDHRFEHLGGHLFVSWTNKYIYTLPFSCLGYICIFSMKHVPVEVMAFNACQHVN